MLVHISVNKDFQDKKSVQNLIDSFLIKDVNWSRLEFFNFAVLTGNITEAIIESLRSSPMVKDVSIDGIKSI